MGGIVVSRAALDWWSPMPGRTSLYAVSWLLGGPVSDPDLIFLKFPISASEIQIFFAILSFAD